MKIIDLLNKIANGEEVPKKIKFCLRTFVFIENDYICLDSNTDLGNCNGLSIHKWIYSNNLNDEVEILEEKKIPEKLEEYADVSGDLAYEWTFGEKKLKDKTNEIIDYLNYLKSKGE